MERTDPYELLNKAEARTKALRRNQRKNLKVSGERARARFEAKLAPLRAELTNIATDVRAGVPRAKVAEQINLILERLHA